MTKLHSVQNSNPHRAMATRPLQSCVCGEGGSVGGGGGGGGRDAGGHGTSKPQVSKLYAGEPWPLCYNLRLEDPSQEPEIFPLLATHTSV